MHSARVQEYPAVKKAAASSARVRDRLVPMADKAQDWQDILKGNTLLVREAANTCTTITRQARRVP